MENIYKKNQKLLIVSLFLLSLFLTLYRFTSTPKVWVDEGVFTEFSRNLKTNGVIGIQISPGNVEEINGWVLSTSYPVLFPVALSMKMFGVGVLQSRLPMVIYILLFLLVSYLFVRKKYGEYPAFISTLLLLSFSPLYGNGRPVQGEVPGLFYLMLGSYLLLLLEDSGYKNLKIAVFSGLSFGLSCATKPIYLTFVSISLVISLIFIYKKVENKKIFPYFFIGFLIPIIIWFYIHFPTVKLITGALSSYMYLAGTHGSDVSAFQTILINLKRFFTEGTPILFSFASIITIFSFGLRFYKSKINIFSVSEILIFSFIFLNWLGYLKGTGWYRYFFPSHVLLYVLFVGAIFSISNYVNNVIGKKILYSIPILLLIFQFYHLVFLSETSFVVNRTRNLELSNVLGNIPKEKSVFFFNSIETIVFLKSNNYSQYLKMDDFLVVGDENSLSKQGPDYFLTDTSQSGNVALSCYIEKPLSQYFFLEKTTKCKTK